MKKLGIILLICGALSLVAFSLINSKPKYFEGEITFVRQNYSDLPKEYLIDTFRIYCKQGKRMVKREERPIVFNLIDANEFRSYSLINDTLFKQSIADIGGGMLNMKKMSSKKEIAGYPCKSINADFIHATDTAKYTFWYTDKLKLHSTFLHTYRDNIKDNLYQVIDGIILGIERMDKDGKVLNKDFAVKVDIKTLNDNIFTLPEKPIKEGNP